MKRFASAVALVFSFLVSPAVLAQNPPPTPAPSAPQKWVPPIKGVATIQVIRESKVVGKELVTKLKIKNTSTGAIHLLKIDETWYDKKREVVTGGQGIYRKPFLPGEIIDIEIKSPMRGQPDISQFVFRHANGRVDAKVVKKFAETT